jgi:hypothetical protein
MAKFEDFIPQNIAPVGIHRIGIYDSNGNRVGVIPLGNLTPPDHTNKLYSFGALADVHYPSDDSETDFKRALIYFNDTGEVMFIVICGDLVTDGTASQLTGYKNIVQSYSPNVAVYAEAGNHDCYASLQSRIEEYTGNPLNYSFEQGNDVFIMVGTSGINESSFLSTDALQWLYEVLERNRNKRCFLFFHVLIKGGCGDPANLYWGDKLGDETNSVVFKSLLQHYRNTIFFHAHSHMRFSLQEYWDNANYDSIFGCHSVHIPSVSIPRDSDGSDVTVYTDGSEGYVVDVYENGIHLRGRDFVKGEFLPIASYWLDTTLQTIPAGTYTDSTGTIIT